MALTDTFVYFHNSSEALRIIPSSLFTQHASIITFILYVLKLKKKKKTKPHNTLLIVLYIVGSLSCWIILRYPVYLRENLIVCDLNTVKDEETIKYSSTVLFGD